jgi:hypothetical protein
MNTGSFSKNIEYRTTSASCGIENGYAALSGLVSRALPHTRGAAPGYDIAPLRGFAVAALPPFRKCARENRLGLKLPSAQVIQ